MKNDQVMQKLTEMESRLASLLDTTYDVAAACKYLNIARPTLYRLVSENKITHCKATSKLVFYKSDLDAFLSKGRVKSVDRMHEEYKS